MLFLKQMFSDHIKGWQSITIWFNVPSFVKIPNIRKWGQGLKEALFYSLPPLSPAAQLLLALQGRLGTEGLPRSQSGGLPSSSPYFSIPGVTFTGIHLGAVYGAIGQRVGE